MSCCGHICRDTSMTRPDSTTIPNLPQAGALHVSDLRGPAESLKLCFGVGCSILDTGIGAFLDEGELAYRGDAHNLLEQCVEVLRRGHPEFIAQADPVAA